MSGLLFTVGEALYVFLAQGAGPLSQAGAFDRLVSGAEVNVAAGVVQAGHRARLVSRVGADPLGDAVVAQVLEWGIDARIAREAGAPTGVLIRTTGGAASGGRGPRAAPAEAVNMRVGAAAERISAADVASA